ncbi:hypothetical protein PAECIP111893_01775 [Paenibacillus plantiphilus]|uniref:Thioredoxin family protein n=1 Tax=Paenibacillus plantiphilus TaxID=2905650 RepID=A0ABN8GA46_9BACL|nr:thioredoxin family protein [Paenibacillus plantiphilus]CAH1201936.1 hypothetical protein PAECIP111893_01775 [Paenibacillus plantiphilus]
MNIHLQSVMGTGIQPQQFIDGMTRNKESLLEWYNRFRWESQEDEHFFRSLRARGTWRCLILCTEWCPDVIWNLPVLLHVLKHGEIPVEILVMEQHLDTMDLFLTNGGRAQPIALFVDAASGAVVGQWGPRPQYIQAVMQQFRRDNPDREEPGYQDMVAAARKEIAALYHAGTEYQAVIVQELRQLLTTIIQTEERPI